MHLLFNVFRIHSIIQNAKLKTYDTHVYVDKNELGPFLWIRFNRPKASETLRGDDRWMLICISLIRDHY